MQLLEQLQGKKTYLIAFGAVVAVVVAFLTGELTAADAVVRVLEVLGLATLRAGVAKV